MIAEFNIENFFSIKSPQKISFEPSSDTFMSDEYSYEVKDGIKLLKVGIIYGANASGKSNILNAVEFFRTLVLKREMMAAQRPKRENWGCSFHAG